jgi:hypothetical protein
MQGWVKTQYQQGLTLFYHVPALSKLLPLTEWHDVLPFSGLKRLNPFNSSGGLDFIERGDFF